MTDDRLYLLYISECIRRIQQYTADGRETFRADTMRQDAVLRNLHTLAESTQRLSLALQVSRPDVDWRGIGAFRNVVVHNYLSVDLNLIWDIIEPDLPDLKGKVEEILKELA